MIGDEGEQIGIMPPFEALKMAREKKDREAKKHQKTITVKEVKFRINVDDHDYETKKNHVLRFLDEGDKVKATIFFRGREMTRTGLGRQILERLIKDIGDRGLVEFRPRQENYEVPGDQPDDDEREERLGVLDDDPAASGRVPRALKDCENETAGADVVRRWGNGPGLAEFAGWKKGGRPSG